MLEIDRDGFDQWDKRIIETLIYKFNGGPVGLSSLAWRSEKRPARWKK
jgi:Holliday junction DNA helicase RuvB